jgi:hypothetical protein
MLGGKAKTFLNLKEEKEIQAYVRPMKTFKA